MGPSGQVARAVPDPKTRGALSQQDSSRPSAHYATIIYYTHASTVGQALERRLGKVITARFSPRVTFESRARRKIDSAFFVIFSDFLHKLYDLDPVSRPQFPTNRETTGMRRQ